MSKRSKYKDGESILCYQGLLIYEAKIQGVKNEGNGFLYDIHYKGWNKTWDEWVIEERVMKINEANIQKQKDVAIEVKSQKSFAAKKTGAGGLVDKSLKRSNSESPDDQMDGKGSSREVSKDRDVTRPTLSRVKKLRSRSNSDASIVSITSSKSVDSKKSVELRKSEKAKLVKPQIKLKKIIIKGKSQEKPISEPVVEEDILVEEEEPPSRPKTRLVKPMAVLKTATDVPKSHKKSKKKKKGKEEPNPVKVTKTPVKKSKKASKPKVKKSTSVPPVEEPLLRYKREFGQEIVIPLSDELKAILVDDVDYIGRQRKLLHVPSRYTVDDLINAYYEARKGIEGETAEELLGAEEVCRGLKDYFNSTLGSQLLYKFERVQYSDTLKENTGVPMAQLYGPVHLLRLLTKLGPMLSAADIEQDAMDNLIGHVKDFIGYMHKHRETLYQVEDYGTATPEYHRRAL